MELLPREHLTVVASYLLPLLGFWWAICWLYQEIIRLIIGAIFLCFIGLCIQFIYLLSC